MKNAVFITMAIAILLFFSPQIGFAQGVAKYQTHYLLQSGVALQGYDAVAYTQNKAQKGTAAFSYTYHGIKYQFANASNLSTFKQNPDRYEPPYGGWCAYAMAKNDKVKPNPKNFKLIGGQVYLFYDDFFSDTLNYWNKDQTNLKQKADTYWKGIFK